MLKALRPHRRFRFMAKFIKEMSDVRALGKMTQQEKVVVFEKRNYYDNHA